jgi:RecA/RadA recombinase
VHGQTLTKLQYLAVTRFDGDTDLALGYLGLAGPGLTPSGWVESLPPAEIPRDPRDDMGSGMTATDQPSPEPDLVPDMSDPNDQLEPDVRKPLTSENVSSHDPSPLVTGDLGSDSHRDPFWRADETAEIRELIKQAAKRQEVEARARELREYRISGGTLRMRIKAASSIMTTAVEASVAHRADGVAILYRGRVNTIWGPSESAKSWFSLCCAIDTLSRGGSVLIIDTEDDESGFDSRMTAIGWPKHPRASYVQLMMAPTSIERDELLAAAKAADLVVVDSLDGLLAILALESNNATAVRTAGAMLKQWAQAGNAAVLVVDHSTEKVTEGKPATAMGSSAKKQLIDGVMLRADRETEWKPQALCTTMIMLGKDRHGQVKQWAEYKSDAPGERAFGRLARLQMVSSSPDTPSVLSLLRPPSYTDMPETLIRATKDEIKAIEGQLLTALIDAKGKLLSRTDLLAVAGDKNDRKGYSQILDALAERNPPEGLLGGIKVHISKHGQETRYHYSWESPDTKGDSTDD